MPRPLIILVVGMMLLGSGCREIVKCPNDKYWKDEEGTHLCFDRGNDNAYEVLIKNGEARVRLYKPTK